MSKNFTAYQLPILAWAVTIFILSSIPQHDFPTINIMGIDKVAHILLYGAFFFFAQNALKHQQRFPLLGRHHFLIAMLLTAIYGVSDELHQLLVPGRSCDIMDLLADMTGALLCLVLLWIFQGNRRPDEA